MTSQKDGPIVGRMVYKGITLWNCDMERIKNMDILDDDVFVCTYPRSGTTMTQELTYLVQTLDFDTASKVVVNERVPWIDGEASQAPIFRSVDGVEALKPPRTVKCHLPYDFLPTQLQNGRGKIISVVRNPKDVAHSFYNLMKWTNQAHTYTLEDYVDKFVKGDVVIGLWTDHVLGYWNHRNQGNMMVMRYEDIVTDMPAAIRRTADFIGRKLSGDMVRKIADHCYVDQMRDNPMTNGDFLRPYVQVRDDIGGFINKGKPGVWKDVMTPEMSRKIDSLMTPLVGTGLTFDFA